MEYSRKRRTKVEEQRGGLKGYGGGGVVPREELVTLVEGFRETGLKGLGKVAGPRIGTRGGLELTAR